MNGMDGDLERRDWTREGRHRRPVVYYIMIPPYDNAGIENIECKGCQLEKLHVLSFGATHITDPRLESSTLTPNPKHNPQRTTPRCKT